MTIQQELFHNNRLCRVVKCLKMALNKRFFFMKKLWWMVVEVREMKVLQFANDGLYVFMEESNDHVLLNFFCVYGGSPVFFSTVRNWSARN